MNKLGKSLYHSTSILTVKFLTFFVFAILFANLNYQTLGNEEFQQFVVLKGLEGLSVVSQVFKFHMTYPEEYIFFLITVAFPTIYYGFIRGVTFHENGVVINKGLPFFNYTIFYSDVSNFEIIHSKYFLSITLKETEDDILFTVNNVDRALAILDQHGITGDLGIKAKKDTGAHVKLLIFFLVSGMLVALFQYSGFIRSLFK